MVSGTARDAPGDPPDDLPYDPADDEPYDPADDPADDPVYDEPDGPPGDAANNAPNKPAGKPNKQDAPNKPAGKPAGKPGKPVGKPNKQDAPNKQAGKPGKQDAPGQDAPDGPPRYKTVPRNKMPGNFWDSPGQVLGDMAEKYQGEMYRRYGRPVEQHSDWAVRMELDPERAMPVARAGVSQRERWVEFRGIVQRVNQPIPLPLKLAWACGECTWSSSFSPEIRLRACPDCKSVQIRINHAESVFVDTQYVTLGDHYEDVVGTRPPRSLVCRLDGTLIQRLSPGDHCVVGGVMRLTQSKKTGYDYELLVNNTVPFRPVKEVDPPEITGDVMDVLMKSFAPDVHGHYNIKESILLLLVSGSAALPGRNDINILLVGDPGMAKSSLLVEAAKTAPLGRYASGRGSTAAGLTAGLAKDRDGVMYVEAGATVLTDTGTLCVDEFDKMTKTDRSALHEVMEQQQTTLAKMGFFLTMKARVSILAAANPKTGFWDDDATLADNIDLPQTMLTRFDLIYNLRDIADTDTDGLIADTILYGGNPDVLPQESLTAYIASVRPLKPKMSVEAARQIRQYYIRARADPGEIRMTPRQLEGVKRLAGARAKIYRREEITGEDATRAIYLVEHMIQKTMVDPATGKPDHAKATGGQSRSAVRLVDEAMADIEDEFTAADIAEKTKLSFPDIERALDHLSQKGVVMEGKPGLYKRVR